MTRRALIAAAAGAATFASLSVLAHAEPLALARLAVLGAALVAQAPRRALHGELSPMRLR